MTLITGNFRPQKAFSLPSLLAPISTAVVSLWSAKAHESFEAPSLGAFRSFWIFQSKDEKLRSFWGLTFCCLPQKAWTNRQAGLCFHFVGNISQSQTRTGTSHQHLEALSIERNLWNLLIAKHSTITTAAEVSTDKKKSSNWNESFRPDKACSDRRTQ